MMGGGPLCISKCDFSPCSGGVLMGSNVADAQPCSAVTKQTVTHTAPKAPDLGLSGTFGSSLCPFSRCLKIPGDAGSTYCIPGVPRWPRGQRPPQLPGGPWLPRWTAPWGQSYPKWARSGEFTFRPGTAPSCPSPATPVNGCGSHTPGSTFASAYFLSGRGALGGAAASPSQQHGSPLRREKGQVTEP
jgi:hypothetical protein